MLFSRLCLGKSCARPAPARGTPPEYLLMITGISRVLAVLEAFDIERQVTCELYREAFAHGFLHDFIVFTSLEELFNAGAKHHPHWLASLAFADVHRGLAVTCAAGSNEGFVVSLLFAKHLRLYQPTLAALCLRWLLAANHKLYQLQRPAMSYQRCL